MQRSRSSETTQFELPPNRTFGLVFCLVFALVAVWPLVFGGRLRLWAAVVCGLFAVAALQFPDSLTPLNRLWMRFGALLHRVVSPIVLAVLFFVVITPFAIVMKAFKRDGLRLRRESIDTYWVDREPPGPTPESLTNQF